MFTTLPRPAHHHPFQNYDHIPQVSSPLSSSPLRGSSSPLSPRDVNIPSRLMSMSSPTRPSKSGEESRAKRPIKKNPLIHRSDDARETRRSLFLRKVREDSEDKRWQARGGDDEMMRTIWVAEQRRRAERQALEAQNVPADYEEDVELDDANSRCQSSQRTNGDMVDEVLQQENEEIEALLSMMDSESNGVPQKPSRGPESLYGSDDEDYDSLFMEVIDKQGNLSRQRDLEQRNAESHDLMDTS
ncbi:MAG: hypothetical protein M1818_008347 [Claussenomyces sp. TS43310]|nr:MAG: hypothetical protein M1818_008347 [Claussenomyces sp. TS43310]